MFRQVALMHPRAPSSADELTSKGNNHHEASLTDQWGMAEHQVGNRFHSDERSGQHFCDCSFGWRPNERYTVQDDWGYARHKRHAT